MRQNFSVGSSMPKFEQFFFWRESFGCQQNKKKRQTSKRQYEKLQLFVSNCQMFACPKNWSERPSVLLCTLSRFSTENLKMQLLLANSKIETRSSFPGKKKIKRPYLCLNSWKKCILSTSRFLQLIFEKETSFFFSRDWKKKQEKSLEPKTAVSFFSFF